MNSYDFNLDLNLIKDFACCSNLESFWYDVYVDALNLDFAYFLAVFLSWGGRGCYKYYIS